MREKMSKESENNQTSQRPTSAVPDWELRREPQLEQFEQSELPEDSDQEKPETTQKRRLNTLQKYLILFFIVALALVVVAGIFQQKLRSSSESYESIIAEKENSILTNSSMLSDLQKKYDALLKERDAQKDLIDSLQSENEANRAEAETLRIQTAAEAILFTAQDAYNHKKYSTCREELAKINPDALSPAAKAIYDTLQSKVG